MVFGIGKKKPTTEIPPPEQGEYGDSPRERALMKQYMILQARFAQSNAALQQAEARNAELQNDGQEGVVNSIVSKLTGADRREDYVTVKPSKIRGRIEGATFRVCQPYLVNSSLGYKFGAEIPHKLDLEAIKGEPHIVPVYRFDSKGRPTGAVMPLFPNIRDEHYRPIWEPASQWGDYAGASLMFDDDEKIARIPIPLGESRSFGSTVLPHRVYGCAFPRIESIVGSSALMKAIGLYNYDLVTISLDVDTITSLLNYSYSLERAMRHVGLRRVREWEQRSEDSFKVMQRVMLAQAFLGKGNRLPTAGDVEAGGDYALQNALSLSDNLLAGSAPKRPQAAPQQ